MVGYDLGQSVFKEMIMRMLLGALLVAAFMVVGGGCGAGSAGNTAGGAAGAAQPVAVAFDTHNGYFVSNKFEPGEAVSLVVLRDRKAFDGVFGAGFVMNDKSHRLPADAFDTKIVVAAIKRGKAVVAFTVQEVVVDRGTLVVRYSTAATKQESAEFACPLIVSVPKGDYAAVEFVEDGKSVGRVGVKGAGSQPAQGKMP